jgi:6-phosphogluconolactonase
VEKSAAAKISLPGCDSMSGDHAQRFELISLASDTEVARVAAHRCLDAIGSAERGQPQYVALSGGRIAQKFFNAVAVGSKERALFLANVHFFWSDERCVPPDHPESNFALANKYLLEPLGISAHQIHRIPGEETPKKAAAMATTEMRRSVPANQSGCPILDIIFLGMGEDGHVASLFPNVPLTESDGDIYFHVVAPKPPPHRITLGDDALRAARNVWVLASGPGKERALQTSLTENGTTPLARVLRMRANTKIFTDISAPLTPSP